jgi:hypothetical protein
MTWTIGVTSPGTARTIAHLLERAFAERDALELAADVSRQQVRRAGSPNSWWPGDPEICAGCALAVEQARAYCLDEAHTCDPFCWDDVRCPNCRAVTS